jgi:hypothetical protein
MGKYGQIPLMVRFQFDPLVLEEQRATPQAPTRADGSEVVSALKKQTVNGAGASNVEEQDDPPLKRKVRKSKNVTFDEVSDTCRVMC